MQKSNEKKVLVLSAIAVVTLIAVVVGATYAYFQAQSGGSSDIDASVITSTTDQLSFQVGNGISISASQEDFGQGMPNKSGSTTAKAVLTANNATNTATRNYNLYLDIKNNGFTYTVNEDTPELILTITGPDNQPLESLSGYEYVTVDGVSGFDITEASNAILIADNYEITANPNKTDEWMITVTFINLDSDQNKNTGKTFNADVIIGEEKLATTLADVCTGGESLASCITSLYNERGEEGANGLYYHDGVGAYTNATEEAGDNSYRYSGSNPNNFVCFGSDSETCENDNLYRIIGVFGNEVKLIKYDYANSNMLGTDGDYNASTFAASSYPTYRGNLTTINRYTWNKNNTNTWSESGLNTVNLNTNYINYLNKIDAKWANMIAEHDYQVGGNTWGNLITTVGKQKYENELVNPASDIKETAKIGLMYVSDYGYAADPSYWTTEMYRSDSQDYRLAATSNWMYMGLYEWTISRDSGDTDISFYVHTTGLVDYDHVSTAFNAARPVFYLESAVTYVSGSGSMTDPLRIG